jgi:hypothetical protein
MRTTIIAITILSVASLAGVLPKAWSDPGDLVITRNVSPRVAYRPGTGPVGAKVNPGEGVQSALGLNQYPGGVIAHELSNSDFADVFAGEPMRNGTLTGHGASVTGALATNNLGRGGTIGRTVTGALGGGAGGGIGGIGGVVRQTTGQLVDALKGVGLIGR